ncbi:MAG: contractile injection system tape measure protein [Chitinophagaceae bacterium]|nr:contractile injection system tape measure protein [Chitinophagaceae bacterium]
MYAIHKIEKLNVQVNWSGEGADLSYAGWQQVVNDWLEQLDNSFDELSGTDKVIQLEHLELTIDVWDKDWKFDAGMQLKSALLNVLMKQLEHSDSAALVKSESLWENEFNLLVFFLENGFFTWNVSPERQQELLRNWIKILAGSNNLFKQQLIAWSHRKPDAFFRLVALHDFNVWLDAKPLSENSLLDSHIKFMGIFFRASRAHFSLNLQLIKLNRLWMLSLYTHANLLLPIPDGNISRMQANKFLGFENLYQEFQSYLTHLPEACKPDWLLQFTARAFKYAPIAARLELGEDRIEDEPDTSLGMAGEEAIHYAQEQTMAAWRKELAAVSTSGDYAVSTIVDNAGLVLLAPFLPAFFQRVGLCNSDGKLAYCTLAVNLLQHIASPYGDMQEQQQLLPKLLCGQAPDVFFEKLPLLKIAIFKPEIDNLLTSVIEYWGVLKNTSIEGLRESFLQRDGRLLRKDKQWLLKVEPKAFDLLIGYLPWTISMIKLPWMDEVLKVEWSST